MEKFPLIAFNGSAQDILWATNFALFGEPDIFLTARTSDFFCSLDEVF
jgi:hypothetical protein